MSLRSYTRERWVELSNRIGRHLPTLWLAVIALVAFGAVVPFLLWGYPTTAHDFGFHICSWVDAASQLRHGNDFPRWATLADYGYGEPRFIFYPPASWLLGSALSFVLPWKLVPGTFVWLALTGAGVCMFVFALEWLPPRSALIAAIGYVVNPYHLLVVYRRWAVAELLVSAAFPLVLLLTLRVQGVARRTTVALAAVFAFIWLSNAPGAVITSYTLGVVLVVMAVRNRSPRPLFGGGIALLLGMGLAAFYVIPAAWEQRWVQIETVVAPPFRPEDNFVQLHPAGNKRIIAIAAGNILWTLLLAGLTARSQRRIAGIVPTLTALTCVTSVMMLPISVPLWRHLPVLYFVQMPWRVLFVTNTIAAFLFATALVILNRRQRSALVVATVAYVGITAGVAYTPGEPWKERDHVAKIEQQGGYWTVLEYLPPGGKRHTPFEPIVFSSHAASQPLRSIRLYRPDSIVFEVAAQANGMLRLPVTWYPSWQSEVNGFAAPLHSDNGAVAVPVSRGTNTISLRFTRTLDRTIGVAVSLTFLIVSVGLLISVPRRLVALLTTRRHPSSV